MRIEYSDLQFITAAKPLTGDGERESLDESPLTIRLREASPGRAFGFQLEEDRPKGGMPREMRFRRTAECARSRVAAAAASVILPRTEISLRVQSVRSFFGRFWVKGGILSLQRFQATEALLIPVLRETSPSGIFPRR